MERPSVIKCNMCGCEQVLEFFDSVSCKTCSSINVKILKYIPLDIEDAEIYSDGQAKNTEIRRLRDEIWKQQREYDLQAKKRLYLGLAKFIEVGCGDDIELFKSEYERFIGRPIDFDSRFSCIENMLRNKPPVLREFL